jgi:lactate dehydrogenase-like 2-hydroxyacid dehydrogenase
MKPDVLALGPAFTLLPKVMEEMQRYFTVHHFRDYPTFLDDKLSHRIRGLATESNRGARRDLLALLPKLEIISLFGVGLDLVDLAAARERNLAVTNTPGAVAREVADLAIGLMLASTRQIIFADRFVREGSWKQGPLPLGRSVHGKTLGVVGLGAIGRAIADRAVGFGMHVVYYGPRHKPQSPYAYVGDLIALSKASDVLMVACKGGAETRHLVSAAVIAALGPEGPLIKVARGSVVDEAALIAALQTGTLGYAALDVFENSPNINEAFLALPNVIVQPHQGSAARETREAMGLQVVDNLRAHFEGRPLPSPVSSML